MSMKKTIKLFSLLVLTSLITTFSFAQEVDYTKKIINKWKMIKTEENGQDVQPKHDKLILDIQKKNNVFTITAAFEETHNGLWKLDGNKLTLTDTETKEVKTLTIIEADGDHLTLDNFDGENTTVHFAEATGKKSTVVTNKEFLVAKKWTIYKSDKETNLGTRIEFKQDKTFVLLPWGYQVPTMSGKWQLSEDNSKLIIDAREDGAHIEISLIEIHKHELVLKFEDLGITEYLHDPLLAKNDEKVIAEAHKGEATH